MAMKLSQDELDAFERQSAAKTKRVVVPQQVNTPKRKYTRWVSKQVAVRDLYREAAAWGFQKASEEESEAPFVDRVSYWTAWYAGRRACEALLIEAKRIGLTDEQCELLRKKAAEVAYD